MLELIGYVVTHKSGVMNVKIFDNMPIDTSEVAIQVKNFMYSGYYFDEYNKNPYIIHCEKCGVPFRRRGSRDLYCTEHAKIPPAEPKEYICVDCGATYYKVGFASARCPECKKQYNKEVHRILSKKGMRRFREKKRAEKQACYGDKP